MLSTISIFRIALGGLAVSHKGDYERRYVVSIGKCKFILKIFLHHSNYFPVTNCKGIPPVLKIAS